VECAANGGALARGITATTESRWPSMAQRGNSAVKEKAAAIPPHSKTPGDFRLIIG
jgi:hypothetical protein